MAKIGIITNMHKDKNFSYTKNVITYLINYSCEIYSHIFIKDLINSYNYIEDIYNIKDNIDFLIVLGGDGTILKTIGKIYNKSIPIIGINLGNLGFFTDVEKSKGFLAIEKVLKKEFKIEKRLLLDVKIDNFNKLNFVALNDTYILKNNFSNIINITLKINNQYVDTYKTDGIIISTPSGSTAYNLSAGGPILKYDSDCIVITPICPHKLFIRPLIVSGKDTISISIKDTYDSLNCYLIIDGYKKISLKKGQTVHIKKSKYFAHIIKTNDLNFYQLLKQKFYN